MPGSQMTSLRIERNKLSTFGYLVSLLCFFLIIFTPISAHAFPVTTPTLKRGIASIPTDLAIGNVSFTTSAFSNSVPVFSATDASESALDPNEREPILFIGTGGYSPQDFRTTDQELKSLLHGFSFAALSVRSFSPRNCESEGWMSLRVTGDVVDRNQIFDPISTEPKICNNIALSLPYSDFFSDPTSVSITSFSRHILNVVWPVHQVFSDNAWAVGRYATLPLANAQGEVKTWLPYPGDSTRSPVAVRQMMKQILQEAPGDVVVDVGVMRGSGGSILYLPRAEQIQEELRNVLAANAESERPRKVIIASLADKWTRPHLQFFATNLPLGPASTVNAAADITASTVTDSAASENKEASNAQTTKTQLNTALLIASPTTRTVGFLALQDLRDIVAGKYTNFTLVPAANVDTAMQKVVEYTQQAHAARDATAYWYENFNYLVLFSLLVFLVVFLFRPAAPTTRWGISPRVWRAVEYLNTFAFSFIPAAFILNMLPWWKLVLNRTHAQQYSVMFTALIALTLTLVASFFRKPGWAVAVLTFLLLSGDILLGSVNQQNGLMGSLVLTSRRYYGISNRTYLILLVTGLFTALYLAFRYLQARHALLYPAIPVKANPKARILKGTPAISSLLDSVQLADYKRLQRQIVGTFLVIGFGVLLIDALPFWGADFGGPPGLAAGFGIAILLATGIAWRWYWVAGWVLVSGMVMGLAGVLDSRSGQDSHIGKFWGTLGTAENFALISGKIRDVTRSFIQRTDILLGIFMLLCVLACAYYLLRVLDRRSNTHLSSFQEVLKEGQLTPVLVGIMLGILVAVPINDSGALMIKEGLFIAIPILVSSFANARATLK